MARLTETIARLHEVTVETVNVEKSPTATTRHTAPPHVLSSAERIALTWCEREARNYRSKTLAPMHQALVWLSWQIKVGKVPLE